MLLLWGMMWVGVEHTHGFSTDPLPRRYWIYVSKEGALSTLPLEGFELQILPVSNLFTSKPGCYLTCNSTNPDKKIYSISTNNHVVGMIRVKGEYEGEVCKPKDYEKAEIKDEPFFKSLCSRAYQCPGNSCWAFPYTGALFGLR